MVKAIRAGLNGSASSDRPEIQNRVKQYLVGAAVELLGIGCLLIAVPLLKLLVVTAVLETSPSGSFAGDGAKSDGGEFSSCVFCQEKISINTTATTLALQGFLAAEQL